MKTPNFIICSQFAFLFFPSSLLAFDMQRTGLISNFNFVPRLGSAIVPYAGFPPIMGSDGNAIFTGAIRDEGFLVGSGLFAGNASGSPMERIASQGDPVPGSDGNYTTSIYPQTADAGRVFFEVVVQNSIRSDESERYMVFDPAKSPKSNEILRGTSSHPTLGVVRLLSVVSNGVDHISIVTANDPANLLRKTLSSGKFIQVLKSYETMIGVDRVDNLSSWHTINRVGQMAVVGDLTNPATFRPSTALLRSDGSNHSILLRIGDPVPNDPGLYIGNVQEPRITTAGAVVFRASLNSKATNQPAGNGLFAVNEPSITTIAKIGQKAPDGNGFFLMNFVNQFVTNPAGTVLFGSDLSGATLGKGFGLFLHSGTGLTQVARTGHNAPGGGVFTAFPAESMSINSNGEVVFLAGIDKPGVGVPGQTDSFGIFFRTTSGKLMPVALTGAPMPGGRTVDWLELDGAAGEMAGMLTSGLNDRSQVAYRLSDGTDIHVAIWTLDPPQPEIDVFQPKSRGIIDGKFTKTFKNQKIGRKGERCIFTIRNSGKAVLKNLAVSTSGKNSADFAITQPRLRSLNPGASTTFVVTFKPKAKGLKRAIIRIASNDSNENPFDINLKGTGK